MSRHHTVSHDLSSKSQPPRPGRPPVNPPLLTTRPREKTMAKRTREDSSPPAAAQTKPSSSESVDASARSPNKHTHLLPSSSTTASNPSSSSTTAAQRRGETMHCALPPHASNPVVFATYSAYEIHYAQAHENRCSSCGRNFPTAHFLGLHISENHDPLRAVRKERGEKTFACLVEDCERLCSSAEKRRRHCVDRHLFPRVRAMLPRSLEAVGGHG